MYFTKGSAEHDGQVESIFLVRTETFDPEPHQSPAVLHEEGTDDMRWWTLEDIASSTEVFTPRDLSNLLEDLLENGPPATPLEVEV